MLTVENYFKPDWNPSLPDRRIYWYTGSGYILDMDDRISFVWRSLVSLNSLERLTRLGGTN